MIHTYSQLEKESKKSPKILPCGITIVNICDHYFRYHFIFTQGKKELDIIPRQTTLKCKILSLFLLELHS